MFQGSDLGEEWLLVTSWGGLLSRDKARCIWPKHCWDVKYVLLCCHDGALKLIRKTSHVHYSYTKVFLFFKTDANAMVFAELLPLLLLVLNLRTKILILTKNLTKDLRMASEELSKGGSAEEVQVFFNLLVQSSRQRSFCTNILWCLNEENWTRWRIIWHVNYVVRG